MDKLKNLVRFRRASSAKRTSGGVSKGGGGRSPPFATFVGVFDFNEIHRPEDF